MTWLQVVVLAIVQGISEFLPISSSGHLVLVPVAFGWSDQGLAFDVAVHFGSLIAVCIFFWNDVKALVRGGFSVLGFKFDSREAQMALAIGLGTLPAAIAGLTLAGWIEANLRDPSVIVFTLAGYGIAMVLADRLCSREKGFDKITIKHAVIIGCAQALALIPGTSRSGVTITAGRMLGFDRRDAARFSFLLSVPVILMATIFQMGSLAVSGAEVPWMQFLVGVVVSAIVAYISIEFFMRVVTKIGLLPFAIYRILLAAVILYVLV